MNILVKPPGKLPEKYAHDARWMMFCRNRHTTTDYDAINEEVAQSKNRAGPPMLRLAKAVWSFEDRRLFPDDAAIVAIEENDFSHLMAAHRSVAKARQYRVWKAMEDFVAIRHKTYGKAALIDLQVPPLDQLDWRVPKGVMGIDLCDTYYRGEGQPKDELTQITTVCLNLHPLNFADAIALLGTTVWKLERWNRSSRRDKILEYHHTMANAALWNYWKEGGRHLQESPFAKAMDYLNLFYADFPPAR